MNSFKCPQCRGSLNPKDDITLLAKNEDGEKALILLNKAMGNYTMYKDPHFHMQDNAFIELFCPVCRVNLASLTPHSNLAKLLLVDKNGKEYDIFISGIMGEKCSYKVRGGKVELFGKDANKYSGVLSKIFGS